jgi:ABC-type transporter Mla maintaining outer membrane lipid asymmetry permease subunit MlaE
MTDTKYRVTVEAIDIPFLRLVMFFVKAGLAAVPALFIIMAIFMLFGAMMHGLFGMGFGGRYWHY